jgi:sterol desaturase/sphingolipid hydroxylase (fatty acid hydroxylase superfamily)
MAFVHSMPTVYIVMLAVLAVSGVLMALSLIGFKFLPVRMKIHDKANPALMQGTALLKSMGINSAISTGMLFGFVFLMGDRLISAAPVPVWRIALDVVATLLVYDFVYYFLHRDLFHGWKPLIKVHSVHHIGKYPTAADSLYIHPVETILGVMVLLGCFALFGPMSLWSFGIVLFFYTHLNITVHWGLDFRVFPLNLVSYMSRKHDVHHKSMRAGNYASITPLPDIMFRTGQATARTAEEVRARAA